MLAPETSRRVRTASLLALALACAPVIPAPAAEFAPSPSADAARARDAALTPGPPSSRFT